MYYAIFGYDAPNSLSVRLQVREEHLARVDALSKDGRLLIAGPHPAVDSEDPGDDGFTGSLIVAEFSSLEDAKHWVSQDPYVVSGVFSHVEVKPFKLVAP